MSTRFNKALSNIPAETQAMVSKSFDVVERILDILMVKNMSQKDLANLLGKRESEISKWMKGGHNFTLETITRIENALGEVVLTVPNKLNNCADNSYDMGMPSSSKGNLSPVVPLRCKDISQLKVK